MIEITDDKKSKAQSFSADINEFIPDIVGYGHSKESALRNLESVVKTQLDKLNTALVQIKELKKG